MSWAKFDDQFYDHPKIRSIDPLAAFLWVCSISYSARHLTDGFVPQTMPRALINLEEKPHTKTLLDALVRQLLKVGLWHKAEGGYQVHDYLEYNPPKAKVLAGRARDRGRKQYSVPGGIQAESARNPGAPSPSPSPSPIPDPVPKTKKKKAALSRSSQNGGHPGFEEFWKLWPQWRRVAKAKAKASWDRLKPSLEDVQATLAWQVPVWEEKEPEFTPHPTTWLNHERWQDERPPDCNAPPPAPKEDPDWPQRPGYNLLKYNANGTPLEGGPRYVPVDYEPL